MKLLSSKLYVYAALCLVSSKTVDAVSTISAKLSPYYVTDPQNGSCRLSDVKKNSLNYKSLISVAAKDVDFNAGCGRCVRVTELSSQKSVVGYVTDVCQNCEKGDLKVSLSLLPALGLAETVTNIKASYTFTNCPENLMTGPISACLMEGASDSYIPIQFYNSQRVIRYATINGLEAEANKNGFFYSVSPVVVEPNKEWYKNIKVTLQTSNKEATVDTVFSFPGKKGCVASTGQFNVAQTAEGPTGESNGGDSIGGAEALGNTSSSGGLLVLMIVGALVAVIVLAGSVFYFRKRTPSSDSRIYPPNGPRPPVYDVDVEQGLTYPPSKPLDSTTHPDSSDETTDNQMSPSAEDNLYYNAPGSPTASNSRSKNASVASSTTTSTKQAVAMVSEDDRVTHVSASNFQPEHAFTSSTNSAVSSTSSGSTSAFPTYKFSNSEYATPLVKARSRNSLLINSHAKTIGAATAVSTSAAKVAESSGHVRVPAPVLPNARSSILRKSTSSDEERSSFDIDDMRRTELDKSGSRQLTTEEIEQELRATNIYSSGYKQPDTVTSPLSYGRMTSGFGYTTSQKFHADISSAPKSTGSSASSTVPSSTAPSSTAPSSASIYQINSNNANLAPQKPRELDHSFISDTSDVIESPRLGENSKLLHSTSISFSQRSTSPITTPTERSSFKESGSTLPGDGTHRRGYSSDSLSILGYPLARKSSRGSAPGPPSSSTEVHF